MDVALFVGMYIGLWIVGFTGGYALTIFRRAMDQVS